MPNEEGRPQLPWTTRVLGLVTEVRHGEAGTALLFTLNIFLLLAGYYILKPVRENLIYRQPGGAEVKSYLSAAIAVMLMLAVPAYAAFANRVPRNRLVVTVTLIFSSNLVLFYLGSLVEAIETRLGIAFYVWIGIFGMMVVAQIWAFANDIYTEEQGARLFALLGLGASLGGVTGPLISAALEDTVDVYDRMLLVAVILAVAAGLSQWIHRRERNKAPATSAADRPPASSRGAFRLVFTHRYLLLIAIFSLLFTLVNTNGEYVFGKLASRAAHALGTEKGLQGEALKEFVGNFVGAAFNDLFLWVNILSLLIQTFLVSRVIKYLGLRRGFFILPAIALLSSTAVAIVPALSVIKLGKTAENATDYSLNNTLRNILWLPTTTAMKYKAKQATDTFFVRMGDVTSALMVFVGTGVLALPMRAFAITNVGLVLIWLGVAAMIVVEHGRLRRRQSP